MRVGAGVVAVPALAAIVASAVVAPAQATPTTYTWIGSCSSPRSDVAWSENCNWSPNGVPKSGDSVTIGPGAQIQGVPDIALANLTITGGGQLGTAIPVTQGGPVLADTVLLDCAQVVNVAITSPNVTVTGASLASVPLTIPTGGQMVARYPGFVDDGCVGHPTLSSLAGQVRLSFDSLLTVGGRLHGDGGRIVGGVAQSRLVVKPGGTIGLGSERLILDSVTTELGGQVDGTGVVVAGRSRTLLLRGTAAADPPGTQRLRLKPGAVLTVQSAAAPDTGGFATVDVSGTVALATGSTLRLGNGADVDGTATYTGAGRLSVAAPVAAGQNRAYLCGRHTTSSTTTLVMRGQVTVGCSGSVVIAGGPASITGEVRVNAGNRLRLTSFTDIGPAALDSDGCCSSRGSLEVPDGATLRLLSGTTTEVKYLRMSIGGRMLLRGADLRTDTAVVGVGQTGALVGPGRVFGDVTSNGTMSLSSCCALRVVGDLTLGSTAKTRLGLLSSAVASQQLVVTGKARLGGALELSAGSTPPSGLALVVAGTRQGTFAAASGIPPRFRLVYGTTAVRLVTP